MERYLWAEVHGVGACHHCCFCFDVQKVLEERIVKMRWCEIEVVHVRVNVSEKGVIVIVIVIVERGKKMNRRKDGRIVAVAAVAVVEDGGR